MVSCIRINVKVAVISFGELDKWNFTLNAKELSGKKYTNS